MENLIKYLEDKITDKMSVEEIVDVFEQMCSTPLEEDMVLFDTGTFTEYSKEPFFQISLVRQFSNSDEEFYQIHVVILYKPTAENKIFSELSSNGQETVFVPFYGQSDSAGLSGVERIYFKGINGEISNRDIREFDVLIGEKLKYYQKTDLYASKILLKQMIDIMFLIAGAIVIFKLI